MAAVLWFSPRSLHHAYVVFDVARAKSALSFNAGLYCYAIEFEAQARKVQNYQYWWSLLFIWFLAASVHQLGFFIPHHLSGYVRAAVFIVQL